jgi:hypothetical protein
LEGSYCWRAGFVASSAYIIRGIIGFSILPNLWIVTGVAHVGVYQNEKWHVKNFDLIKIFNTNKLFGN